MKNSLVYLRVSTPKQADEGESLDVQEAICRRYAEMNGFHVLEVFREPYTGRKEDRPVLSEMFAYVEKQRHLIDIVIIRDIDRFTRGGSYFYELFKNRLLENGVELIDTAGIIQPTRNTLEDTGFEYDWSRVSPSRISESMAAEQAREEITKILTRTIGQQIRLVNEGYRTRPAPLGYRNKRIEDQAGKKKTTLESDPTEAAWIKTMFELRAEGILTDQEICHRVNAMGFRTRRRRRRDKITRKVLRETGGLPMTPNMLQKFVRNPVYCGVILEKWTKGVPVPASFDGLVSVETFNLANQGKIELAKDEEGVFAVEYDVKKRPYKIENPAYPYRFVVSCPHCHKPFKGSASRGKLGRRYPAYHCSRGHSYLRIPQKTFHETVQRYVSQLQFRQKFLELFERMALDTWRRKQREAVELTCKSGETVVELQKQQMRLLDQFTETESPVVKKLLERQMEEIEAKVTSATDVRRQHEISEDKIRAYIGRAKYLIENPAELLLDTASHGRLRQLWAFTFEEIPTFKEIERRTPKLSVLFEFSQDGDGAESRMAEQLSLRWNTFVKQVGAGCALPMKLFQVSCGSALSPSMSS